MYSMDKSLVGPRNGMDAEEKIELPRTFKESNPDSLHVLYYTDWTIPAYG